MFVDLWTIAKFYRETDFLELREIKFALLQIYI